MRNLHYSWFVIVALSAVLWVPYMFAYGMFMDGVYNALLAKNLYQNISTFWVPQSVGCNHPESWGTPPLSIGILAFCYTLFGDMFFVERIYSFMCAIIQLILIERIWSVTFRDNLRVKNYSWLPCLLFVMSPLIGWCYSGNLMENSMSIFTSSAMLIMLNYVKKPKHLVLASFLTSLALLLGFITKGPVALFPMALPILFIGINKEYKTSVALYFTLLNTLLFSLLFIVLFSFTEPAQFLANYMAVQIKPALNHNTVSEGTQYQILIDLLIAISLNLALLVIAFCFHKYYNKGNSIKQYAYRFLVLGLCGSIPILLSIKQRKFYLLPAMVAYSVGFAILVQPLFEMLEIKISNRIKLAIKTVSVLVVLSCLFLSTNNYGSYVRDEALLKDLQILDEKTGSEKVISAESSFLEQWLMRGYFLRLYNKKICTKDEVTDTRFYMSQPTSVPTDNNGQYKKIFSGNFFDLYENI